MGSSVTVAIRDRMRHSRPDTFKAANVQNTSLETISAFVRRANWSSTPNRSGLGSGRFQTSLIGGKDARRARIEPERRSFRLTAQQAAQGRIIARIRSDDTIPVFGTGPWWTWWWVDSVGTVVGGPSLFRKMGNPPYHVPPDRSSWNTPGLSVQASDRTVPRVSIETPKGDPFLSKAGVTRVGLLQAAFTGGAAATKLIWERGCGRVTQAA